MSTYGKQGLDDMQHRESVASLAVVMWQTQCREPQKISINNQLINIGTAENYRYLRPWQINGYW